MSSMHLLPSVVIDYNIRPEVFLNKLCSCKQSFQFPPIHSHTHDLQIAYHMRIPLAFTTRSLIKYFRLVESVLSLGVNVNARSWIC